MGVFDGSGLPAVPADQVETTAALGIGTVGDDAEVTRAVSVAQQLALARADADGEIAARRDRVFFPDAIAGQIIDLGPFADGVGLFSVYFPMILGQRGDALGQLRAHIGRDRIADRLVVEPAPQPGLLDARVPP